MTKSTTQPAQHQLNDRSRALNPNRGTNGTNRENGKANGNRGQQLNPNKR